MRFGIPLLTISVQEKAREKESGKWREKSSKKQSGGSPAKESPYGKWSSTQHKFVGKCVESVKEKDYYDAVTVDGKTVRLRSFVSPLRFIFY